MAKTRNFEELISLFKRAESSMISHGITDVAHRIVLFRTIYYGAPWSKDFAAEQSVVRNWVFSIYTGSFGSVLDDPRPVIGSSLFKDLQDSQDVRDRGFAIDVGHVMIGLEARISATARTLNNPLIGGTGLEGSTWLGDLGGGAANLAWKRANMPLTEASYLFSSRGSDYGASINLEGDIGAYVIGSKSDTMVSPPNFGTGGVSDLFRNYLPVKEITQLWRNRSKSFLQICGGKFVGNLLSNKKELIASFEEKINTNAIAYLSKTYMITDFKRTTNACAFIEGASKEIAIIFVSALENNINRPLSLIQGTNFPKPTPKGECKSIVLNSASYKLAYDEILRTGKKAAQDMLREIIDN